MKIKSYHIDKTINYNYQCYDELSSGTFHKRVLNREGAVTEQLVSFAMLR